MCLLLGPIVSARGLLNPQLGNSIMRIFYDLLNTDPSTLKGLLALEMKRDCGNLPDGGLIDEQSLRENIQRCSDELVEETIVLHVLFPGSSLVKLGG